ncbi:hypothetical protein [Aliarcobacter butzleri]|uniref:hypothetical protein n=1 Tax=Aliarcobacter butzleri TaxID=28197 RepID=UPI0021B36804|nr:hypothetical protein [Aliarcobacter butzleri]MCT7581813.1 hypothetical protein [Aliarcobacter butzleri]
MQNYFYKIKVETLLKYFFISSLFFVLLFFVADFFTVYYKYSTAKFIFLDERRIFLEKNILKLFGVTTILIIIGIFLKLRKDIKFYLSDKYLVAFVAIFITYNILNGSELRPMFFFGILITMFIYGIAIKLINQNYIEYNFLRIKKFIIYILSIFLLTPLLIHFTHVLLTNEVYFAFEYVPQLYIVDSFRGFTLDRIQYSFLAGILILFLLFDKKDIKYNKIILGLTIFAIFLAMSRAVIVAIFCALIFYYIIENKNKSQSIKFIIISIIFILIAYFVSNRMELFSDGGGRMMLLNHSLDKIFESGYKSFLFGSGDFYTTYLNGLYPHNSILQSIMDFGFIITIFWLFLLYRFFKILRNQAKVMFIYIFIFGMFHAGFSVFVFMPITLFGYVCVLILNSKENINL